MGLELDAKQASRLRQWFHKSLRAVTNLPAHLTKISNDDLCARFGVKEPVTALHDLTRNKLRKLHSLPEDHISAAPCVLDHWAACERALEVLRHTTNLVSVQMPSGCGGVPCPECGQYFTSIKAVRQHVARRHGIKTATLKDIEYRQEEHSQEGMPQCVHCGKRCGSSDGLRHHILTNACHWYQPNAASASKLPRPANEAATRSGNIAGMESPGPTIDTEAKLGGDPPRPQSLDAAVPAEPQAAQDCPMSEPGHLPAQESDEHVPGDIVMLTETVLEPRVNAVTEPIEVAEASQGTQTGQLVGPYHASAIQCSTVRQRHTPSLYRLGGQTEAALQPLQ